MPKKKQPAPWCPDKCPITGRAFFMWITHPERGYVPTYGGPFDSFTLCEPDDDGTFMCERYDHDAGEWMDAWEWIDLRLIDGQREDHEHGTVAELQTELARQKWVPVSEQMPDSGKKVIAFYRNEQGKGRRIFAEYMAPFSREMVDFDSDTLEPAYREDDDTAYWPEGWYETVENWDDVTHLVVNDPVTHWMEIPVEPEAQA